MACLVVLLHVSAWLICRQLHLGSGSTLDGRISIKFRSRQRLQAQATCKGEPLHTLDKKREGSSGAAPPLVPSLLEGTFWIRERLNLTYDVMQGGKKSHHFNPACCAPCSPRDAQNFLLSYLTGAAFNHNLLN